MPNRFDLIVRNGTVIDGTGAEPRVADVAVQDDRIAGIGPVTGAGREEIDAKGMAVTPASSTSIRTMTGRSPGTIASRPRRAMA